MELFLSALSQEFPVRVGPGAEGRSAIVGVPILRVGKWKGRHYTAELLQQYAEQFETIRVKHSWLPPLRPRHLEFDAKGLPLQSDVRDTLGYWSRLYYDPATQTLFGDAEVGDATAQAVAAGTMRYVSAELSPQLTVGGDVYHNVFSGAAFVEHPAVTGLPWSVVCNSEDYPELMAEREGKPMAETWYDRLKALFARDAEVTPDELVATLSEATSENEALRVRAEAAEVALAEQRQEAEKLSAEVAAQEQTAHLVDCTTRADALLAERYILPAQRDGVLQLLSESDAERGAALEAVLRAGAQITEQYFVALSDNSEPDQEAIIAEKVKRMAHAQGIKEV